VSDPGVRQTRLVPAPSQNLSTERLRLSPLAADALSDYTALRGDPRTRVFSRSGAPVPPDEARRELQESSDSWHANGFGNWCLRTHDGTFVGVIHAVPAGEPPSPELGWTIVPECWGVGLATEAARVVVADLFDRARVTHITSFLQTANTASARIAQKLGMRLVARRDGVDRYELQRTS
jgi:RimJ/RimL family protein N-acetyltransferase